MATTAFDVVLKELSERRDVITQALAGGSAKDFAEYQNMCGEIRGLLYAHAIITDLVRNLEFSEDV
jgi:hypothetical protein